MLKSLLRRSGFDTYIVPSNTVSKLDGINAEGSSPPTNGSLEIYLIINRTVLVKAYVMVLIIAMCTFLRFVHYMSPHSPAQG